MSGFIRLGGKVQGNAASRVVASGRVVLEQSLGPLVFVPGPARARLDLAALEIGTQPLGKTRLAPLRLPLGLAPGWILSGLVVHVAEFSFHRRIAKHLS
jgi:hypothetical protein